jgi:hypothetical protein
MSTDTYFLPKKLYEALKNMDLGPGIREKTVPEPGSKGQKGTGPQIRIRNTESNHNNRPVLRVPVPHLGNVVITCLTTPR